MDSLLQFLGALAASVIAFWGGMATSRAQATAISIKTFQDLVNQVQALSNDLKKAREESGAEIEKLRDEFDKLEDKNRALWQYVYAMIEHMERNGIELLKPPAELESDPKLMKMIVEYTRKKR